jgi:circadian clock protein KaiB
MKSSLISPHEPNNTCEKPIVLRLFVAGENPTYRRAVRCIKAFCKEELDENYELEIVDIVRQPEIAERMNVLATPALIKVSPEPVQHICGDLSDRERLVAELLPQRRPK